MIGWQKIIYTDSVNVVGKIVKQNELFPYGALIRLTKKVFIKDVIKDRGATMGTPSYPFIVKKLIWYRNDDMPENSYLESDDIEIVDLPFNQL